MSIQPAGGAPSFNRPEFVRFDSLRDSKDLGAITDIKAHLSGFIGAEAGTQSLFFSFELLVPGAIQVQTVTGNKWTQRFVSVGLRSETGSIGLDERGNARGVDIVNTISPDESLIPFPPGKYAVVVSCSQWQATPFGLTLRVSPTTRLQVALIGRGGLGMGRSRLRVAVAKLEGNLTGLGQLRAPGSGLFAGRRDRPLGSGFLTGRGGLTGTPSIREPLRSLAGGFLVGRGGFGASTLISNALGPRMWVSRLATPTEVSSGAPEPRSSICLTPSNYTYHTFYFLPAGAPSSQRLLAIVFRSPSGQVLWSRLSHIFVDPGDTGGWQCAGLPNSEDMVMFRNHFLIPFVGEGNNNPRGLYVIRVRSDGTIAWKRNIQADFFVQSNTFSNDIGSCVDVTYHPGRDRLIFTCQQGAFEHCYISVNPSNGNVISIRGLAGGTLNSGLSLNSFVRRNGPRIRPDGRLILSGAKFNAAPGYTWVVECDSDFLSPSLLHKYTDGSGTAFGGPIALHGDGSITLTGDGEQGWLRLNADFTLRERMARTQFDQNTSNLSLVVDADDTIHIGGGFVTSSSYINSRDYEGNISYRHVIAHGVPGRTDQNSTRRPGPWFKVEDNWVVFATSAVGVSPGLGVLCVGHELDMAPTTVSGGGYAITAGVDERIANAWDVDPPVLALNFDVLLAGVEPISFRSPEATATTDAPSWDPIFLDASLALTFEYGSSPVRRGVTSGFPRFRSKPVPVQEPDSLRSFVSLHLPGSGYPDTPFFVDYSAFSHQAIPLGNVKYSIAQARFPDIGGFFERTSIAFDGVEDAIAYEPSPGFRFGRESFTIEAWIYRLPTGNTRTLFSNSRTIDASAHPNSFRLDVNSGGALLLWVNNGYRNASPFATDNPVPLSVRSRVVPANAWTHVALSREDQIWRLYINGQVDPYGWRFDLDLTAGALLIGRGPGEPPNVPSPFAGFMADIRVTRGVARYHRNFQPRNAPIQYTPFGPPLSLPAGNEPAESGPATTDLRFNNLLLFARMNGNDNVFRDSGPYDHLIIPFGNVTQIPGGKWGGSQATFDAFGDWMEVPSSPSLALGTGDFTVTLWATRTGEGRDPEFFQALLDARTAEPESQFCLRVNRVATGRQLCLYVGGAIRILGEPTVAGVRYHIAVVRRSGVTTLYMNGSPVGSPWTDVTNYTATNWTIGRARLADGADQWYFQGRLNDVRIERGAVYDGAFTPPVAPFGSPPSAIARYWRLVDLRPYLGFSGAFSLSQIALHQGRNRLPGITVTSLPLPSSGLLTNTQDLSTTLNCSWDRPSMEQIGSWIQLDAGEPVTADGLRLATAGQTSGGVSGLTLQYSGDAANWTTLGHVADIPTSESALGPRLGFMSLPGPPADFSDPDFDRVVLFIRGNEPGSTVLDSSPRALAVDSVNVSKSTIESTQGGQSLLFSAGSNAYLTLGSTGGDTQRRSVFFSFGTGALTIEMDVFPLAVPPVNAVLYSTNPIGGAASYPDGFLWVLTSQLKLDLFINGAFRGVSLTSVQLGRWNRLRLSRDAIGVWRYTINGVVDGTTFTNAVDISSRAFTIGRDGANTNTPWFYNGYMDEIRITRGVTRDNVITITNLNWTGLGQGRLVGALAT